MAIIIGSGAGAGLLAAELVRAGIPTTILEKGPYVDSEAINTDGTCVGGSTLIEMASMPRALELNDFGIDLASYYDYVENLLGVKQMDDSHIGNATKIFVEATRKSVLEPRKC